MQCAVGRGGVAPGILVLPLPKIHAELMPGMHSLAHNGFLSDQADKVRRNAPGGVLVLPLPYIYSSG